MDSSDEITRSGVRWTDWELAATAQESGRAAEVLSRWQSSDAGRQAIVDVMAQVFRAATSVRSAHQWAERIVELHHPDALSRQRHFAVQALRLYTLQGVTVGWNTALSVLLMSDGLVSGAAAGVAAQRYADAIFMAILQPDPGGTMGSGRSRSSDTVGGPLMPRGGDGDVQPEDRAQVG